MTNACPDLVALEDASSASTRSHRAVCSSCRLVVELLEERRRGLVERDLQRECARFEMLIAAREEGTIGGTAGELLAVHLRECADCAAVAATLVPTNKRNAQVSLPAVSTASYALGREVARGGMGRILEALDVRIGRPVAVKELLGKAPSLAARFEREARVTARLQHPGIVPIYEIGKWPDGTPFYAMRMVEGRTLRETIAGKPTLDERLALLPALIAAADAVAFAHGKRIIHRDLTPNNVLVGAYGETVVIDWGLAKDLSDPEDDVAAGPYRDEPVAAATLTSVGAVIGTAAYMPPEQASGAVVDERADVYALGAILYHVLAGASPYRASASEEVVKQVKAGPPRAIAEVAPGAPRDLASIITKAMHREATARYATAGELVTELRRFQNGRLVEAHHYSRGEQWARWVRAHRARVLAAAAAAVAVAVAGTIGLAGVLRERERAEAGERDATQQRVSAERTSAALLEELGLRELDAGSPERAAALLSAAYSAGDTSTSLRFALRSAMISIDGVERALVGDAHHVGAIVFDRDGERLAAVHGEVVELWSVADGALGARLTERGAWMTDATFSGDGRTLVTSGTDGKVRVWDVRDGRLVRALPVQHAAVALPSEDGAQVLAVQQDGTATRWEVATGAATAHAELGPMHNNRDWNGWSRYLIAPEGDRLLIWDWQRSPAPTKAATWRVARNTEVAKDGARFLICDEDRHDPRVWDGSGAPIATFHAAEPIGLCSFVDHGDRVVGSDLGHVTIWDVATQKQVSSVNDGFGAAPLGDSRLLAVRLKGDITVVDRATGTLLASYGRTETLPAVSAAGLIAIGRANGSIDVVRPGRDRLLGRYIHAEHAGDIVTAVGDRVLVHDGSGATLWDIRTGRAVAALGWPAAMTDWPLAARDNQRTRAVSVRDGAAIVIDAATGSELARVPLPPGPVDDLALDRSGERLLTMRAGQPAHVWRVSDGARLADVRVECCATLAPSSDRVFAFDQFKALRLASFGGGSAETLDTHPYTWATDAAGSRIAWEHTPVNFDRPAGSVTVEDVATRSRVLDLPAAWSLAFDRRGDRLAIATMSALELWDLAARRRIMTTPLPDDFGNAPSLDLSPDGELIATPVGIWSATGGRRLATFAPPTLTPIDVRTVHDEPSQSFDTFAVGFSPNGATAVMFTVHSDVTLWDTSLEMRSPNEIAKLVAERVPWSLQNGRLVPTNATGATSP